MLSIVTKSANDDSTQVTMHFNGNFEELVNATDAVLHDLTEALIENCDDDSKVDAIAKIFLGRFAHHMAGAVAKRLKVGIKD